MALNTRTVEGEKPVSMRHEIPDVAAGHEQVDADRLADDLDTGRARGRMRATYRRCREAVQGGPHFFLADGSDVHNPGVEMHQVGSPDVGVARLQRRTSVLSRRIAGCVLGRDVPTLLAEAGFTVVALETYDDEHSPKTAGYFYKGRAAA